MSARRAASLCLALLTGWAGRAKAQDVPSPPSQQYEEQYIGFDDFGGVVTHDGVVTGTVQWTVPYEGKYKKPLTGAEFYRKLGRADLAQSYTDRQALRTGLMVSGVLVAIASMVAGIASFASGHEDCGPPTSPGFSACVDRNVHQGPDTGTALLFLGGTLVGGGLMWAGAAVDPNPVSPVEARRLAEAYNRELRERVTPPPAPGKIDVRVLPRLERSGAGVSLAIRF